MDIQLGTAKIVENSACMGYNIDKYTCRRTDGGEFTGLLERKISEFNRKYDVEHSLEYFATVNRDIKRRWKEDSAQIKNRWQYIESVSDVVSCVNGFIGRVDYFKDKKGIREDAYDMDLELYKAISAIRKMAQCYDMDDKFDFHTFGKDDIDNLFSTLYSGLKDMEDVNMRREMQD